MKHEDELHDATLRELAKQLGARAAERLDVDRTAQAVVTRLREQSRASLWARLGMQPAWLKVAATVAVVLGAAVVARAVLHEPSVTSAAVVPVAEDLSDLTPQQLRETMRSLDQPLLGETAGAVETGLEGLSADELRALLRTLEG